MIKKTLAFTLAETLIVMGIIGVVSALTLPNLNSSTGEKEKVAKVKKIYQNLDDALGRAKVVYGPFNEWFQNDTTSAAQATRFGERITEFMKVSKNCGNSTGCWAANTFSVDGSKYDGSHDYSSQKYSIILADGTSVLFENTDCITFDIDGPNKGKNKFGTDLFTISITNNELDLSFRDNRVLSGQFDNSYATAWIIMNDNMDYLKCSGLNWETKTGCK